MEQRRRATRRIGAAAGLVGLGLVGLVLAQSMMGGFQGNPYGTAGHMMGQGFGFSSGMTGGMGMMGGEGMMQLYSPTFRPISEEDAEGRITSFADRFGPNVRVQDLMEFSNNFYAQIVEKEDGTGVAEVLVDRYSGVAMPEPGPNMMWNNAVGVMGSGFGPRRRFEQPARFDGAAASDRAEDFLEGYLPGATVRNGQVFSGYYTFDFGREAVEGMLSVNAYTGEIWVHGWHGEYLGGHD